MTRFLIPVQGLELEVPWTLGACTLHPSERAKALVREKRSDVGRALDPLEARAEDVLRDAAAAELEADDIHEALAALRDALDLVRVFQQSIALVPTASFGLPGDVRLARTWYFDLEQDASVGFIDDGEVLGAQLRASCQQQWVARRFDECERFLGRRDLKPGPARLMHAIRLLAMATREHRPAFQTLYSVIATETLLGGGRTFQLARRSAYLTCGFRLDNRCGRDRPSCEFLTIDPSSDGGLEQLKRMRKRAEQDTRYRCSEWLDFVLRYEDRSVVAHGDPSRAVHPDDASRDVFWVLHDLLPATMPFLLDHPADPAADLAEALTRLPEPPTQAP